MPSLVKLDRSVGKSLEQLNDAKLAIRLLEALRKLESEPLPSQSKKLAGWQDTYRLRVGDYRIIYVIRHEVIHVTRIAHRREVYR